MTPALGHTICTWSPPYIVALSSGALCSVMFITVNLVTVYALTVHMYTDVIISMGIFNTRTLQDRISHSLLTNSYVSVAIIAFISTEFPVIMLHTVKVRTTAFYTTRRTMAVECVRPTRFCRVSTREEKK